MERLEIIPFGRKLDELWDIAKGIGHFIFDHLRHEGVSGHITTPQIIQPQLPFNRWDSEGRYFEE